MTLQELHTQLTNLLTTRPDLANKDVTMEIVSSYTEISSGDSLSGEIHRIEIDFDKNPRQSWGGITLHADYS